MRRRSSGISSDVLIAFLLLIFFGWIGNFTAFAVVFAALLVWRFVQAVWALFNWGGQVQSSSDDDPEPAQEIVSPVVEQDPQRVVSERALQRAGQIRVNQWAQLSDIGLLVYEETTSPEIIRLGEVPTNATHIRPFVIFHPSRATVASISIRFDLIDGEGTLRYTMRSFSRLKPDVNFITPPTWLPMADLHPGGTWSLQVTIGNGAPIAIHEFKWMEVGGELRAALTGDGEIDGRMKGFIDEHTAIDESISLDDLLGEQGAIAPATMQEKEEA